MRNLRHSRRTATRRRPHASLIALLALAGCLWAAAPAMAEFGIQRFAFSAREENGAPDLQAGSHPYALTTTFALNLEAPIPGNLKAVKLELPQGLVGDPDATPRCSYANFIKEINKHEPSGCAADTAVGVASSYLTETVQAAQGVVTPTSSAVYNLVPAAGAAAEFGYVAAHATPVLLVSTVRTGGDYGVTTSAPEINQAVEIAASKVTIWGVPADPVHNIIRGHCVRVTGGLERPAEEPGTGLREGEDELEGPIGEYGSEAPVQPTGEAQATGGCKSEGDQLPLLRMPSSCAAGQTATISVESWQEPKRQRTATASLPPLTGCEHVPFSSVVEVNPEKSAGSTPTGLGVDVSIPQEGLENPTGIATADARTTTITLPPGLQVNPSSGNGLQGCSESQVGYTGSKELNAAGEPGVQTPQFSEEVANPVTGEQQTDLCPAASKVANVKVTSPLLEGALEGGMYLASPQNDLTGLPQNPFSSLIALYLIAEEPKTGVIVKLPGRVELGEPGLANGLQPGQIRTTFAQTPQLPFSDLHVQFFSGQRASLATPAHCGVYASVASLTSWASGIPFTTSPAAFGISSGPGGTACPGATLPFSPSLQAGVSNLNAGSFTPLTTTLGREDGQQALQNVSVTYPAGVSAVLAGVPECPEAQANAGTCAAETQIGEASASAGVGSDPVSVGGGRVYLTGPYEGAPFGVSIVTPAVAGPFNLGNVIVRGRIEINPTSAQVTVTTGAIPTILRGIPLDIQRVNVIVNRPGFTINPTSCDPVSVTGTVTGAEGASFGVSSPFQLANCQNLKFAPKFAASTAARTSRGQGASLTTTIEEPAGALTTQANIAKVKVQLPKQLPSELRTLQKACLAKTFEQSPEACVAESPHAKVGEATVQTPLLPVPLTGNAYLVSHGGEEFPNLTIVLKGDGVTIVLTGDTNISKGITTTTFKTVPDVPFTSFQLTLPEGEDSALGAYLPDSAHNSFCGQSLTMPTEIVAQNGMAEYQETHIAVTGCPTSISVKASRVRKRTLSLTVYVPAAGKLTESARGLPTRSKAAAGQQLLTFTVSPKRGGRLKTKIKLTFTPSKGRKQTRTVAASFKP